MSLPEWTSWWQKGWWCKRCETYIPINEVNANEHHETHGKACYGEAVLWSDYVDELAGKLVRNVFYGNPVAAAKDGLPAILKLFMELGKEPCEFTWCSTDTPCFPCRARELARQYPQGMS